MGNLINNRICNYNPESLPPADLDDNLKAPAPAPEPAPSYANYNSNIESNLLLAIFKGEKDEEIIKEIGRTEVFEGSSELDLFRSNKLPVKYCFGDNQPLILRLYHVYPENHSTLVADLMLHEEELLAESSVLLSQIVVGMESTCSLRLENKQMGQHIGTLTVQAEETVASRGLLIKICTHNGISKKAPVSDLAKRNSEESSHGLKKNRNSQLSVDILESHSFLDFINNGYEIGLMVAVDFAVTDVDPEGLDPFHIIDSSGNLNAYLQVLKDIGRAIEHYDSDRRFPAWCFGGKLTGKCCPASTWNRIQPIVKGVEGILEAYRSALAEVKFHSPTSLSEVIEKASSFVSEPCDRNCRKYYVLLIVTNGDLLGIQDTIDSLVKASNLPLSILIVGVGDDKRFEKMKKLCPGHLLKDFKGVLALRDIVRFMPKCNVSGSVVGKGMEVTKKILKICADLNCLISVARTADLLR
uniref:Copine C-terminal domain-containing protein n=1 Tax=Chenopodium quinoa TaxID=63459 RepID=A0A803KPI7_CHEQI